MIKKTLITATMLLSMHTQSMYVDGIKICSDGTYMDTLTGKMGKLEGFPTHPQVVMIEPMEDILTASEHDDGYIAEDENLKLQLAMVTLSQILKNDDPTDSESDKEEERKDTPISACLMRSPSSMPIPHKNQLK